MPLRLASSSNLEAFLTVYASSFGSEGIAEYVESLPAPEARWYRWLGVRSDAEIDAWPTRPFLADYLAAVDRMHFRAFGVLALAYLHLAYDFPRFLADSFAEFPDVPADRRYRAYAHGTDGIRQAMIAESRPAALGVLRVFRPLAPRDRPLAVGWILAHRCVAWVTAERLAAASDRPAMERRLWDGIDRAARTWLASFPLRWMRELPLSCDLVADVASTERAASCRADPPVPAAGGIPG